MNHKKIIIIIAVVCVAALIVGAGVLALKQGKKKEKITIACIGDSITYGYSLSAQEQQAYPARLQEMLGEEYEVKNFGINGATARLQSQTPYILESAFTDSKLCRPDIILIMLGTNDTAPGVWDKEAFIKDYTFILKSYKLSYKPQVYILLPPPVDLDEIGNDMPRGSVLETEVIDLLKQIAKQNNVKTIDLFSLFKEHPEWLSDGCHPNEQGAEQIAKAVYEQLGV